jgi:hypothetical protein
MKVSGIKGVRVDKKKKKNSPPKRAEGKAGGPGSEADLDANKNLNELIGKDDKKVQSLFQAVKLVKNIHLRNEDIEKMD